jgi:hypothetical protein
MGESQATLFLALVGWATVDATVYLAGQRCWSRFGRGVLPVVAGTTPITGPSYVALAATSKRVPG